MARFNRYLKENIKVAIEGDEIEHVTSRIKRDCKPFLTFLKRLKGDYWLTSGRKNNDFFVTKQVRKDRKPKDTNPTLHNALDKAFANAFGLKARSGSLFTYLQSNKSFAAGEFSNIYGNIYLVFPIGNYKLVYSNEVFDLYDDIGNWFIDKFGVSQRNPIITGTLKGSYSDKVFVRKVPGWQGKFANIDPDMYKYDIVFPSEFKQLKQDFPDYAKEYDGEEFGELLQGLLNGLVKEAYHADMDMDKLDIKKYFKREIMLVADKVHMIKADMLYKKLDKDMGSFWKELME